MYLEESNNDLKDYLKKQIIEIEKEVNQKCIDYKNNLLKIKKMENDLLNYKQEDELYEESFPYWNDIKSISEEQLNIKINTFDFIEELKENIKDLENQIFILSKTIQLQKDNIDLLIKKIVDLKVNLNWVSGD